MPNEILALLVEDDERLARFTAEFLEQHGVGVNRVADGEAALRAARTRSFDVVILELDRGSKFWLVLASPEIATSPTVVV